MRTGEGGGARRRGKERGMKVERIYKMEEGRGGRENERGRGIRDEGMICRRDEY